MCGNDLLLNPERRESTTADWLAANSGYLGMEIGLLCNSRPLPTQHAFAEINETWELNERRWLQHVTRIIPKERG